jgi:hypothetical protein
LSPLPSSAWGAGNVSLPHIPSYFYPDIQNFFPNKLPYYFHSKKRKEKKEKAHIEPKTVILGKFNTLLSPIDKSFRQKI